MTAHSRRRPDGPIPIILLLATLSAGTPRAAHSTDFSWASAVSGLASDPLRWTPVGTPNAASNLLFDVAGAYKVTFPSSLPSVQHNDVKSGSVTLHFDAPFSCSRLAVLAVTGTSLSTIEQGTVTATDIRVGEIGVAGNTLTLSGPSTHLTGAGHIGLEDTSTLNVLGGADLTVGPANFVLAQTTGSGTLNVSGQSSGFVPSRVLIPANGASPLVIGRGGTGHLSISTGGSVDADCDIRVGLFSTQPSTIDVGPRGGGVNGATYLRAHRTLLVGGNATAGQAGGEAVLSVYAGSFVETGGALEVGDPDAPVAGTQGLLRQYEGSLLTASGGVRFWPTPSPNDQPLALYGGVLHVHSGSFDWPSTKTLYVTSQVGTPKLWIANGLTNFGPHTGTGISQLLIARAGAGEVRIARPGTVFSCGAGATSLADSAGGNGSIAVDSSGTLLSNGPLYLGVRGSGSLDVTRAGFCDVVELGLGAVAGATGTASVRGSLSRIRAHDDVWVGGGFGGAGGTGSVLVDSSAVMELQTSGIVSPPLMTVYGGGSVVVANDGQFQSTGTISNAGQVELRRGRLAVLGLSQPAAGHLRGWGTIAGPVGGGTTTVNNNGEIDPFADADSFGAIDVTGNLNLFAASHDRVDLGRSGGVRSDSLRVTGTAALAGALDLTLDPTFVRVPGDTFTVLTCGTRSGTFGSVTWNGAPLGTQAQVVYTPTRVLVVITNGTAAVNEGGAIPTRYRLSAGGTRSRLAFTLDLPGGADVDVRLHDVTGREVAVLGRGAFSAGRHSLTLPGEAATLPSGVYFARAAITSAGTTISRTAKASLVR